MSTPPTTGLPSRCDFDATKEVLARATLAPEQTTGSSSPVPDHRALLRIQSCESEPNEVARALCKCPAPMSMACILHTVLRFSTQITGLDCLFWSILRCKHRESDGDSMDCYPEISLAYTQRGSLSTVQHQAIVICRCRSLQMLTAKMIRTVAHMSSTCAKPCARLTFL